MFEQLTTEGRLLRVLSALCKQNGGELRIPCELVDNPGEATKIDFVRDRRTQEFIVRGTKENEVLLESMRLNPEKPRVANTPIDVVTPRESAPPTPPDNGYAKSSKGLSDDELNILEKKLQKRRIATMMLEDLRQRKVAPQQ